MVVMTMAMMICSVSSTVYLLTACRNCPTSAEALEVYKRDLVSSFSFSLHVDESSKGVKNTDMDTYAPSVD